MPVGRLLESPSELQAMEPPTEEEEASERVADESDLSVGPLAEPGPVRPRRQASKGGGDALPLDEMDAKATLQFSGLVLDDGLLRSVWDLSSDSMRRRDQPAKDAEDVVGGRYRILEPLATGGMARIYRVQHLDLGKEFALKIIHTDLSEDPQTRKVFIREARVSSLLEHPNIVQVTDFGVDPRHGAYLVLEYLRGETLHDRLSREGRLRVGSALDIALQVAEGLHYMHQQNIIHCDIKPENIFLHQGALDGRRRLQVKLIDFGLSRREALGARLASTEVGGTPHFMSPEQIRGFAPQPSMDIYALGVLLYEMVSGSLPFDGEIEEVLRAQVHQPPEPPSSRLGEPLGESVDQLILKALEKDPGRRQPSMGQMVFELRTLMEMLGLRAGRGGRTPKEQRAPSPREAPQSPVSSLFALCPCPLFLLDSNLRVLAANPALLELLGASEPEELLGRRLDTERLGLESPPLGRDLLAAIRLNSQVERKVSLGDDSGRFRNSVAWLRPGLDNALGQTIIAGIIVPSGEAPLDPSRPK
ncbi:MAG: protein kinase [Polyangia bacterium]|jgi:serine/threonine-protein kinase|nr:protein kinase [Polyangia bacterium]